MIVLLLSFLLHDAQAARPVFNGRVCFFEDANYLGQSFCMPVGAQEADLVPSGWNDRISSILVLGEASVSLYQDINYRGRKITIKKSVANLAERNLNDAVSSFVAGGKRK